METQRLDIELPAWLAEEIERVAGRYGVGPDDVVKMWLGERVDEGRERAGTR